MKLQDLRGERVLITAGATREEIDPVRFISNHSSGKMGFALAEAALERGAEVIIVAGATSVEPPNVHIVRCYSAEEMHKTVLSILPQISIFIGAAAVADYRPKNKAIEKIKKTKETLLLELEKTPDILASVAASGHQNLLVVGFAAETSNLEKHARQKLLSKNLDLIVANSIVQPDVGFGADKNQVIILNRKIQQIVKLPLLSKRETAEKILDEIIKFKNYRE